jgi:hypothetical protein
MSGCTLPEMRRLLMSEVYGEAKYLLAWLEDQDVSYVLATKRNHTLTAAAATSGPGTVGHRAAGFI